MKVRGGSFELPEIAGYVGAVLYYTAVVADFERYGMLAVLLTLVMLMSVYVFSYPKYNAGQVMAAFSD